MKTRQYISRVKGGIMAAHVTIATFNAENLFTR
jgi:hypothetical protein